MSKTKPTDDDRTDFQSTDEREAFLNACANLSRVKCARDNAFIVKSETDSHYALIGDEYGSLMDVPIELVESHGFELFVIQTRDIADDLRRELPTTINHGQSTDKNVRPVAVFKFP